MCFLLRTGRSFYTGTTKQWLIGSESKRPNQTASAGFTQIGPKLRHISALLADVLLTVIVSKPV